MKKTTNYLLSGAIIIALLAVGACSKKNDALPQIDGYNNSDEVAKTNLVAHWSFDTDNTEVISKTAPAHTFGTVGSTTGQIGKALQLTAGALVFPPIAKINEANALNNFTVSLWVNAAGTKAGTNGFTSFFGLVPTGATDIWPDICANAETARHLASSDTLELKNLLNTHPVGAGNKIQDNIALKNTDPNSVDLNTGAYFMGAKKWSHYVLKWDGTANVFKLYANGVSVGGYDHKTATGVEIMAVPVQAVFGSLVSSDIGFTGAPAQQSWNPWATASIDDVRVYNTALADKDITALFNLGTAGR